MTRRCNYPSCRQAATHSWALFECESCQTEFAIKEKDEKIDEPICPVCGFEYVVEFREGEEEYERFQKENDDLAEALRGILRYPPFEETNNGERFYEQMRDTAREVLRKYGLEGKEE